MTGNIDTATAPVKPSGIFESKSLKAHAAAIHHLHKRVIGDVVEIGRHLTEAKAELKRELGHGHFGRWLSQECRGWSERTARNYMRAYELSLKTANFADLEIGVSAVHLVAAPSTPEEARIEILERAEAGEQVSGAEVRETIERAKREKTGATAEPADDATVSAEARESLYAAG